MTQTQQPLFNHFSWTEGELQVFRKKEPLTVSQWAEKNRVVRMGANPGPWRNNKTPYSKEIMDTFGLPWIREVVVCKGVQVGGTEVMYNFLGYIMDRSPAPALLVMPDQKIAGRVVIDRLHPMIRDSGCLNSLITSDPDDMARTRISLKNGMILYVSWASSPSLLATMPICYVLFDELDKYLEFSGKEADPVSLGEARTTTYQHTKKLGKVSTPTTENHYIWPALNNCDEIRDYWVPCMECGTFQIMTFDQFRWPEGVDSKRIRRKYLARYECEHCGAHWTDSDRDVSVRAGSWIAREPVERPQSVGFHLPGYYSPFVSLSDGAADFMEAEEEAQTGKKGPLMHWYNSYKAEPYTDVQVDRKEDTILALRDDRPRGLVPPDVSCLIGAVDTQKRGFFYEIRAWGWGLALESWQIREGFVTSFNELSEVLFKSVYRDINGKEYKVAFSVIDSGGTRSDSGESRTSEVYDYCRRNPYIVPIKGQDRKAMNWGETPIDHYPGTKKKIPKGLKLYSLNVTFYKNYLAAKLQIAPDDPGAWHLHKDTTEQYAKHMCQEYKDDRGLWQCPRGRRNDYFDCGVYGLAAAEILGVAYFKRKETEDKPKEKTKPKPKRQSRW